jgi:hypothetical protein
MTSIRRTLMSLLVAIPVLLLASCSAGQDAAPKTVASASSFAVPAAYSILERDDFAVVVGLVKRGADLSEPREEIYYLYFSTGAAAQAAGSKAQRHGWAVDIQAPDAEVHDWAVLCTKPSVVLTPAEVITSVAFFSALAAEQHGEYDGWEASAG